MGLRLGANSYGKSENRVVRVLRDTERHRIVDRTVSTALTGDFTAAHVDGDQSAVLPTDTQKNTVFALAHDLGDAPPEDYARALARHFVDTVPAATGARVEVDQHGWERVQVGGRGHDHTFVRSSAHSRTCVVTVHGDEEHVLSGVRDLVLLKSTGSEFRGFLRDDLTTLQPTEDRVMATSLVAVWRHGDPPAGGWDGSHGAAVAVLTARYAVVHSRALQQTLWEMGRGLLEDQEGLAEVRLSAPNKHHFPVDLSPFGRENRGEVFYAADRPYGLIEAVVQRDDVVRAPGAWEAWPPG